MAFNSLLSTSIDLPPNCKIIATAKRQPRWLGGKNDCETS